MSFLFFCLKRTYSYPRVKTSQTLVNWAQLVSSLSLDFQLIFLNHHNNLHIYIYRSPVAIEALLSELRGGRCPIAHFLWGDLTAIINGLVLPSVLVETRAKSQITVPHQTCLLSFSFFFLLLSFSSSLPLLPSVLPRVYIFVLPLHKRLMCEVGQSYNYTVIPLPETVF